VRKTLTQLHEPHYTGDMNYMRAGVPVVLQPDDAYLKDSGLANRTASFIITFLKPISRWC
jgi:hypothetical protein